MHKTKAENGEPRHLSRSGYSGEQGTMIAERPKSETSTRRKYHSETAPCRVSRGCHASYTDFFDRIDDRIDAREHAAAQRLLKYVQKLYPENEFIREQIIFTAEALGDWEMVNDALSTLLSEADDADEIGDLVFHSVRLLVSKLNRSDEAIALIKMHFSAFIRQPGSIGWTRKYLALGSYRDQLIHMAESAVTSSDPASDTVNVCNALGSWYAMRTEDLHNAFKWYRKVLAIDPGNPEAIDGLISINQSPQQ